jgi:transcriptional regulator with XRE-family HTH domain
MDRQGVKRRIRRHKAVIDPLIGRRVQELRLNRNILQEDIAYRVGVSVGVISRFEQGRQSLSGERLREIARVLKVTTDYLLDMKADEDPSL